MENLTHWKKNNDSRYISGEDLKSELKGLKKEMAVVISKFEDAETFDQSANQKMIRTGFFLSEYPIFYWCILDLDHHQKLVRYLFLFLYLLRLQSN